MKRGSSMKKRTLLGAILLLVVSPIVINLIVKSKPWFGVEAADNNDWIGFYGSYIGGIITLIALVVTIRYTNQQYKDQDRKRVQPYITIKQGDRKKYLNNEGSKAPSASLGMYYTRLEMDKVEKDEKDVYFEKLILRGDLINIGLATAVNIEFYDIYIEKKHLTYSFGNYSYHAIAAGEKIDFIFSFADLVIENKFLSDDSKEMIESEDEFNKFYMVFSMRYEDLLGNKYVQKVRGSIMVIHKTHPSIVLGQVTYPILQPVSQ